ncbi:MAG: hypothetical protein WCE52_04380 [Candidatus Acidiferrum sp.]
MLSNQSLANSFRVLAASTFLLIASGVTHGQTAHNDSVDAATPDVKSLAASMQKLQAQVESLNAQMGEMRSAQQQALLQAEQLRAELQQAKEELAARLGNAREPLTNSLSAPPATPAMKSLSSDAATQSGTSLEVRVSKVEENQDLMNGKIQEQSQTKVESGSKYRLRLSGIVLLNTAVTRGSVDILDYPQIATPTTPPGTSGAFSGSLRQSQIGIEAFGPDIAGAHTSANVNFDFAGGFPNTSNGVAFGIVRLRTGTIRLDWNDTSLVAGQDGLFFAPLTPTTLTSLAIPALSYTGNLWSWTPQVRIEHRITFSDTSNLLLQGGILDSFTGESPTDFYRTPTAGEQSGQPAYAARIAWTRRAFGKDLTLGVGGYYGRQNWGWSHNVDGWAGITDITLPLGKIFDLTAEFYRGRAVGGLGGGIGQSLLLSGPIFDTSTVVRGLDSMGGWVQLKIKPQPKWEINLAYGQDNPYASQLRAFPASAIYYGGPELSRNRSPFVNFMYRVRSDVLFSVEYRRLQTYMLDGLANIANQTSISLGYLF